MSSLNLEDLPTPEIIEELSYKEILEEMKATFIQICPDFSAYLESDPLVKLMEVAAYREVLLRHRINQAAESSLLM